MRTIAAAKVWIEAQAYARRYATSKAQGHHDHHIATLVDEAEMELKASIESLEGPRYQIRACYLREYEWGDGQTVEGWESYPLHQISLVGFPLGEPDHFGVYEYQAPDSGGIRVQDLKSEHDTLLDAVVELERLEGPE